MRQALTALVTTLFLSGSLALGGCGPALDLTEADDGSTQSLAMGEELLVTLESNRSTGASWSLAGALPAQLEQVGESEYLQRPGPPGTPGTETWTFRAAAAGDAVLALEYRQAGELTAEPADTFEVTVQVREGS